MLNEIRAMGGQVDIVGYVPIIAVSAKTQREQAKQAKEASVDNASSKPSQIPTFISIIGSLMEDLNVA